MAEDITKREVGAWAGDGRGIWDCFGKWFTSNFNGLFEWREEGKGVEGSKVVLAKNELILC